MTTPTNTEPMVCDRCGQPHARCTAHTRAGNPCQRHPLAGQRVCDMHGGKTPRALAAAENRQRDAQADAALQAALAEAYGDSVPTVDPAEAMLQAVSWKYAEVIALRRIVGGLGFDERVWGQVREKTGGEDHGSTYEAVPNIWWQRLDRAEEQLVRFAAAARVAGVEDRRVRLAEGAGQLFASAIHAILGRLDLTGYQLELVTTVVPEELRKVAELGGGAS